MFEYMFFSGIYWYPIAALIGYGVTSYFQEKHYQFNSEKDAILRHYIELHPEDFPMPGICSHKMKMLK